MARLEFLVALSEQARPSAGLEARAGFSALRAGHRASWELFLNRMERRCLALAWRLLNDPHLAADSVQEGFLKAYLNRHTMREDGQEERWLLSIVANAARDLGRSTRNRREKSDSELIDLNALRAPEPQQLEEKLRSALATLDEVSRVCFLLVHQEGFTYEQVALEFNWPIGTVRSRLHRARLQLREVLRPERSAP